MASTNDVTSIPEQSAYFGTTLRITNEAVELPDRSYNLSSVDAARVHKINSKRSALVVFVFLAAVGVYLLYETASIILGRDKESADSWISQTVLGACLVVDVAVAVGLFMLYRSIVRGTHYIYVAKLHSRIWSTVIAASASAKGIQGIVDTVNATLAARQKEETPSETRTIYYSEQWIKIGDNSIDSENGTYPLDDVRFASVFLISTENLAIIYLTHPNICAIMVI